MEKILHLYAQPYAPEYPVVCFDERPCFLIGDELNPLPVKPGKVKKEHYAYSKHGSCCLLDAIEPKTGRRLARLERHRKKREFAHFMKALSEKYPEAKLIRVVLGNLNTHDLSALYEVFPVEEAFALAQRFEFSYTPKSASWLNMIEIEFSALSRQCLKRRIPCFHEMQRELLTLVHQREADGLRINWQFSIPKARDTFHSAYQRVNPLNP